LHLICNEMQHGVDFVVCLAQQGVIVGDGERRCPADPVLFTLDTKVVYALSRQHIESKGRILVNLLVGRLGANTDNFSKRDLPVHRLVALVTLPPAEVLVVNLVPAMFER